MRDSYPWMEIGEYLTKKHRPSMIKAERFVCACRKDKPWRNFRYWYPACVFEGNWSVEPAIREDLFETFWECIVREVKRKHPEWVMEAFMTERVNYV